MPGLDCNGKLCGMAGTARQTTGLQGMGSDRIGMDSRGRLRKGAHRIGKASSRDRQGLQRQD